MLGRFMSTPINRVAAVPPLWRASGMKGGKPVEERSL